MLRECPDVHRDFPASAFAQNGKQSGGRSARGDRRPAAVLRSGDAPIGLIGPIRPIRPIRPIFPPAATTARPPTAATTARPPPPATTARPPPPARPPT
ncbi:MAG: hypothetical protein LBT53_00375, partial [Puniceicoccales bacterium]|nr:hypothetical protein [Puniceicoccales bacterium]